MAEFGHEVGLLNKTLPANNAKDWGRRLF